MNDLNHINDRSFDNCKNCNFPKGCAKSVFSKSHPLSRAEKYRKKNAYIVKIFSQDGYSTSLTLDHILDNDLILAHHMNGITLPEERGFPLQLVAESKWGYKWIKWITRIEVSKDRNFKGYWESKGYNNKGDLSGPIFGE